MANPRRRRASSQESSNAAPRSRGEMQEAQKRENRNRRRRELYSTDPDYRARIRQQQREAYHREKGPLTSKLAEGVLRDGVRREMEVNGVDELIVLEGYTLREAGEALGKSMLTIRAWIGNGIIPEPIAWEASTGYQQFLRFELEMMAEILAEHETHSAYVSTQNEELIDDIWRSVADIREGFLEEEAVA